MGRRAKVREPTPLELRRAREVKLEVERARRNEPRPRGAEYFERARELADRLGLDAADVLEAFDVRATARGYDCDRATAERLAWADLEAFYEAQRSVA